jgi:CubicO group peptidase (beta-lactamase class C family)
MNKKIILTLGMLLTGLFYSKAQSLDQIVTAYAATDQFSGVVLVADQGKIVFEKTTGFRVFANQTPLMRSDIFELASVSKQFTGMVIMMLQEKGKLNFDDPADRYLTIPYKGITIRHLLNHTSGLPDYQSVMDQYWDKTKVAVNDDIITYLNRYSPAAEFAPGSNYSYSNTGYVLLASIAEKAGGTDFIEFCRSNIFKKLGMKDTDIRTAAEKKVVRNFALGHVFVPEKNKFERADSFPSSNYTIWLGNRKGLGRISSTAADLLKWDQALYTNLLIQPSTLEEAFTPATISGGRISNYGFGWEIKMDANENKIVLHSGDNPGYKTQIIRFLKSKKTLIVLCNNAISRFPEMIKALEAAVEQ